MTSVQMTMWLQYWPIALFVMNGVIAWAVWSFRKGVATKDDLAKYAKANDDDLQQVENRLTHIEVTLQERDVPRDLSGRVTKLEQAVPPSDLHDRLTRLEAHIEHLPSDSDLQRIHSRMDDVAGELAEMVGQFSGMKGTLDLLHQYLLDEGKRR